MTNDAPNLDDRFAPVERLADPLPQSPMPTVLAWWDRACTERHTPNPHSFVLSTVDPDGAPSSRVVLCKHLDQDGYVVFYSNYDSAKGRSLAVNPVAAASFHWDHLERAIRVVGSVVKSPEGESDAYFATRPWESKIGAWASRQSEPIGSRDELLAQVLDSMIEHGVDPLAVEEGATDVEVPRPPFWGGYRLWAERIEVWAGGPGRVHDRAVWTRSLARAGEFAYETGPWSVSRLQP